MSFEEFSPWVEVLKLPLFAAVAAGSVDTLDLILEGDASIDMTDDDDRTALHLAVEAGSEGVVRLLLEKGANIWKADKGGQCPLCLAPASCSEGVSKVLFDHAKLSETDQNGWKPLHQYAISGPADALEAILKHDDASAVDNSGRSALFLAAGAGSTACVGVLLKHGLDKDRRDNFGRVALDVAVKPEVRALLNPGDEIPDQEAVFSCCNFGTGQNYSRRWVCDQCSRPIDNEFIYRKLHSPSLSMFDQLTDVLDCCKCQDTCTGCFAAKGLCGGDDHGPLKCRFLGDGMLSFSELSPWVAEMKLPVADE